MTLIEDVGMRNKGFRILIVSLMFFILAAMPVLAGNLHNDTGDASNISLYNPSGIKADLEEEINESGYIITTKSQAALFTAPFGSFTLDPDSMMVITDYDEEKPSLYLIDGSSSITVSEKTKLTLYTPTESYRLDTGTYAIEYTEESSIFTNLSENNITLRDVLRGKTYTVGRMSRVDLLANTVEPILGKKSKETLKGTLTVRNTDFEYSIGKGKAIVAYSFTVPSGEVADFIQYLEKEDSRFTGIEYTCYPTSCEFKYPPEASNEVALDYLNDAAEILGRYLGKFNVPAIPQILPPSYSDLYYSGIIETLGVTGQYKATKNGIELTLEKEYRDQAKKYIIEFDSSADVTVADTVFIARKSSAKGNLDYLEKILASLPLSLSASGTGVVSGFRIVRGFTLNYVAANGIATLTYPDFITDDDVEEFFIWAAGRRPAEAALLTYTKDEIPGKVELGYPLAATREDIEYGADLLASEIDAYAGKFRTPAVPEFLPVKTVNVVRVPLAPTVTVTTRVHNIDVEDKTGN